MAWLDIFQTDFRLPRKVCVLAPGPNGRGRYHLIPPEYFVIAVAKAVLIAEVAADLWIMNHVGQDWYRQADRSYDGPRAYSIDAARRIREQSQRRADWYYFHLAEEDLREDVLLPIEGTIRCGTTVSGTAIQLAYNLGAREILLCGVDMSGDTYFDRSLNPHPYHGETWPAVRRLNPLIRWMRKEKGIEIATLSPTKLDVPQRPAGGSTHVR